MPGGSAFVADDISGERHDIGLQRIDLLDNPFEPLGWHIRAGYVDIGQQDNRCSFGLSGSVRKLDLQVSDGWIDGGAVTSDDGKNRATE